MIKLLYLKGLSRLKAFLRRRCRTMTLRSTPRSASSFHTQVPQVSVQDDTASIVERKVAEYQDWPYFLSPVLAAIFNPATNCFKVRGWATLHILSPGTINNRLYNSTPSLYDVKRFYNIRRLGKSSNWFELALFLPFDGPYRNRCRQPRLCEMFPQTI